MRARVDGSGDVFKRMLRDEVAPALRSAGLRGSGVSYSIPSDSHRALGFQGSTANTAVRMRFTVNCTVVPKDAWEAAYEEQPYVGPKPKPNVGVGIGWTERIGMLMPDRRDHWWWLERDGITAVLADEVVSAIVQYALPALRSKMASTS